jgi:MFS family permease
MIVALMAAAVLINYVDRGILATAAPLIKDELRLTNTEIGLLISAFFFVYTPGQFLAGWLVDRINAYRAFFIGLTLWATATALTGLAGSFAMLMALRLLLGLGESAAFPCSSQVLAASLPAHRLGGANGLIMAGLALGTAFGVFFGGLIMAQAGWRAVFIVFGVLSFLWLAPWLIATRRAAPAVRDPTASGPSFIAILKRRGLWGASLGHFSAAYATYFAASWLPTYLVKERGFTVAGMAELLGLLWLVYAAAAQVTGWGCDRWMRTGASANRVRKTALVIGHVGCALSLAAAAPGGVGLTIASLFAAAAFLGAITPNVFAVAQTLSGPDAAGRWMGVENGIANLAGILCPIITGIVVDRTGHFAWGFAIAAVFTGIGVLGWGLMVSRVERLEWPATRTCG